MKRAIIFLTLFLSGCAFTDVRVTLPQSVSTGYSGGNERQVVIMSPLEDKRLHPEKCGIKKNGYNMATAKAICSMDPSTWLAQILETELKSAGFSVVSEETAKPSAIRLNGSLLQIFVEPVIGFTTVKLETDIHVKVKATSETGLLAERSFFVKEADSALVASDGNYQTSLTQGSMRIVKEIVAAIISLMNRYPQLGLYRYGEQVVRIDLLEDNIL